LPRPSLALRRAPIFLSSTLTLDDLAAIVQQTFMGVPELLQIMPSIVGTLF